MWFELIVEDNYDNNVVVWKEGFVFFGDRLLVGNYKVVYKVMDVVGNRFFFMNNNIVVMIVFSNWFGLYSYFCG